MKIIKATNLRLGQSVVGANFEFFRGEFIFIEGKSGSGKSELCRAFYGERRIDGGSLEVAGVSLRQARGGRLMRLRRQIGIVFADFKLVEEWSVERNIILPLLIAGHSRATCAKQAAVFLKELDLVSKAALLPSSLSNGERQRVAIARALISAPQLLVCDEPFSHLDDYWAANVWSLMRQMQESSRKSAIIIATNKIPERFGFAFRRFVLEDGIIAERQIFRKASAE